MRADPVRGRRVIGYLTAATVAEWRNRLLALADDRVRELKHINEQQATALACQQLRIQERDAHIESLLNSLSTEAYIAAVRVAWFEHRRANANAELAWTQRQAALRAEGVPDKRVYAVRDTTGDDAA